MLLPQGSFVLNKMASMHFQTGGMVPTLLEPGEKVFMPGDWDDTISTLNQMIPRFQTGGVVEHLHGDPHRAGYDHGGHSGVNAHDHFAFSSAELRKKVQAALAAGEGPSGRQWEIGSTTGGDHAVNSYHYSGQAFDIPWSQFGSGAIGTNDYEQSRTLAKDVEALVQQFGGTADAIQQNAQGNIAATARTAMGQTADLGQGMADLFGGLFSGLQEFTSGFSEGFQSVVGDHPLLGLLGDIGGGLSGAMNSIGSLFGVQPASAAGTQGATGTPAATSISDPNARALLNAIADAEGTSQYPNSGYNTMFTGRQFQGTAHPRQVISSGAHRSDAAGRYQFLSTTWDEYAKGRDMSPANQDAVALDLVAKKRKVDISDGLSTAEIYRLGQEWASIEGGRDGVAGGSYEGQAKYSAAKFMKMYENYGGTVQRQRGGVVSRRSSDMMQRMRAAQAQHNQSIQLSVKPIVVYEDAPPMEVASMADVAPMPPSLPDGPGSAMASDYFYNLSLGAQ